MPQLYAVSAGGIAAAQDLNQFRDLYRGNTVYDVKNGYGAVGDGVANDTSAIQAAVTAAAGKRVHFPAGNYKITAAITFGVAGSTFTGDGMESTTITLTGAINGFVSTSAQVRCSFRDMSIVGNATTLDAIYLPSAGGNSYQLSFTDMFFYTGGRGVYAPLDFNSTFTNCQFNSYNNHGVEVSAALSSTFINCYVHNIPTGFYGFRTYRGGNFIGCNGLDTGYNWGLFGQSIAAGDAADNQYHCNFIGCNFEGYRNRAVVFRYDGSASFQSCTFLPYTTYDCSVWIEFSVLGRITFDGCAWLATGTRTKLAEVFAQGSANVLFLNTAPTAPTAQIDQGGTLYTVPSMDVHYAAYLTYAARFNQLEFGTARGFVTNPQTTWTANATNFNVTSIDRLVTANSGATQFNYASGGVPGQMIVITVNDANTTIVHNYAANGRFINSSGANITATNGRSYLYVLNGTSGYWYQV